MKLSLRQFLARKLLKGKKHAIIGVSLGLESVALCVLDNKSGTVTWTHDAEFSHHEWVSELDKFVKLHKLSGAKCYVNFTSHYYQILQIDRPAVPEYEIYDALAFPIQEILGSEESLSYDYIEQVIQVSGQNKVSVVAIPDKDVKKVCDAVFDANLELQAINVEELAAVELSPMQDEPILTLAQESGEEIVLNIVRQKNLYFTRRIKGFENLGGYSQEELDMGLVDNLCVQLQRSMDFFESQLRQAPVRKVLIKLDTLLQPHIANKIAATMDVEVSLFEPQIALGEDLNFKMASYSCIGAAYQHYSELLDRAGTSTQSEQQP